MNTSSTGQAVKSSRFWKVTRAVLKRFWGFLAFTIFTVAMLVVLGREMAPRVSDYREQIADFLSQKFNLEIGIGTLHADWQGLSPSVRIENLTVQSLQHEPLIHINSVLADLDLMRSLFRLKPQWNDFQLSGVELAVVEDQNRNWQIRNLNTTNQSQNFTIDDILQLGERMNLSDAAIDIFFRSGHQTRVTFPNLNVESNGSFHRFTTEVAVDGQDEVLQFVMESNGDISDIKTFTAKGYLKFQQFELDRVLATLPGDFWQGLPEQEWRKGNDLNAEVWFDVFSESHITARGKIGVGEIPVELDSEFTPPTSTTGKFVFQWRDLQSWDLSLRDFIFNWHEVKSPVLDVLVSAPDLGSRVMVSLASVDLQAWHQLLSESTFLPQKISDLVQSSQMEGELQNVFLNIDAVDLKQSTIRFNLQQVNNKPFVGIPGFENITGYLEANFDSGVLDVHSSGNETAMLFEKTYEEAIVFDSVQGQLRWLIDFENDFLHLYSGKIVGDGKLGKAIGYFGLDTPLKQNSGLFSELMLQLHVTDTSALIYRDVLPTNAPQSLRDWLDASIQAGDVTTGDFIYRGGVNEKTARNASVQLTLAYENLDIAYHPDWPALKKSNGDIKLNDRRVKANIVAGSLWDGEVVETELDIWRDRESNFSVDLTGRFRGTGGDALKFLTETPVNETIGGQLDSWKLRGNVDAKFDLVVPLAKEQQHDAKQNIDIAIKNTDLIIDRFDVDLQDLNGRIQYKNDEGLFFNGVTGTFLDEPISLTMERQISDGDPMRLDFNGFAEMEALAAWSQRPEVRFLEGKTRVSGYLKLPTASNEMMELELSSGLQGVAVDLPMSYGKEFDGAKNFLLHSRLSSDTQFYDIQYDGANALLNVQDGNLINASIELLPDEPNVSLAAELSEEKQFLIKGKFHQLNWLELTGVYQRYLNFSNEFAIEGGGEFSGSNIAFDIYTDELLYKDQLFDELTVAGKQSDGHWLFDVRSPLVGGAVTWFPDGNNATVIDLDYLKFVGQPEKIEKEEPEVGSSEPFYGTAELISESRDVLKDFDPSVVPSIDFTTQAFAIGEKEYGRWSFQIRPIEHGVQISNIQGVLAGGEVTGLAEDTDQNSGDENVNSNRGARLEWTKNGEEINTSFIGRFDVSNSEAVFSLWEQPQAFVSERAVFDTHLQWPASPTGIELTTINGDVGVRLRDGEFLQSEASAANDILKLFALFNFDTWARRLRFDFSDLYGNGLDFDRVDGKIEFENGIALMVEPVVVESPSSRMQLAGSINLDSFEIDGTLVARLPVGENLTWVAFFAGGLPAAVGTYMVSKIFQRQVDRLASLSYSVKGTINDPNMKFDRLFDSGAAERQGQQTQETRQPTDGQNTKEESAETILE